MKSIFLFIFSLIFSNHLYSKSVSTPINDGDIGPLNPLHEINENHIKVPDDMPTVNAALIRIKNISENIKINTTKAIKIRGTNQSVTVSYPTLEDAPFHIYQTSGQIHISNLTIQGGIYGALVLSRVPVTFSSVVITGANAGIVVNQQPGYESKRTLIENSTITGNTLFGVLSRGSLVSISKSVLTNNGTNFEAILNSRIFLNASYFGPSTEAAFNAMISHSSLFVDRCLFPFSKGSGGMLLEDIADGSSIVNSNFQLNRGAGLILKNSYGVRITNTKFVANHPRKHSDCKTGSPTPQSNDGTTTAPGLYVVSAQVLKNLKPGRKTAIPAGEISNILICPPNQNMDIKGTGLVVTNSSHITISNAEFSFNTETGLFIENSAQIFVKQSQGSYNANYAITSVNSKSFISQGLYESNMGGAIRAYKGDISVTRSSLLSNLPFPDNRFGVGILTEDSVREMISNTISQSGLTGIYLVDSVCFPATNLRNNKITQSDFGIVWTCPTQNGISNNTYSAIKVENEFYYHGNYPKPSPPPVISEDYPPSS